MPAARSAEGHLLSARAEMRVWRLEGHTLLHVLSLLVLCPTLRISSGRRSAARNKQVGGSPRSFHLTGRAVDLVGPLEDLKRAAALARILRVGPGCGGPEEVLLERAGTEGQHLHVAW